MNSTFSILAAIGLSLSTAMAQTSEQNHYKLISLENDSYRNWSKEELLNLILVNREPSFEVIVMEASRNYFLIYFIKIHVRIHSEFIQARIIKTISLLLLSRFVIQMEIP
jgi:hypothetical protein